MIELKNVTKTFGGFKALDDLTLTVPQGAVYGLVGPNGAGKSTAIRHITGIYRPDSGSITVEGLPVYENPQIKQTIGYIPDDVFFFPSATLADMAVFCADAGMVNAINLDGGGSAQMLVKGIRSLHVSDRDPQTHREAERPIPLGLQIH